MGIEEKLFSKYGLKREFGKDFRPYAMDGTRIYNVDGAYIMLQPVNKNQYRIHPAYKRLRD